jgi:hypothetical protein
MIPSTVMCCARELASSRGMVVDDATMLAHLSHTRKKRVHFITAIFVTNLNKL